ncbi:N-acetyltransferase GCN5 [Klebsiella pneumoniae subsp. ozaenae]|uniref:N-acetyltransferase GCN5 n=1 Tax=Klebsiella pneumoniae subsp. ozaenae TaxID=574 RepID=A0A377ZMT0_KLEPO|nr:N-acetyltransferase GCN5 [Klebsiella pneumoniae subsp. ozaenae]
MTTSFSLRTLSRDDILHHLPALSEILASCVNGGASVSFMLPFAPQTAITFWQRTADSVAAGERIVLAAFDAEERPVGTVHYHQSPKTSPIERMRQIIGSPKCPPPGDCPGVDERAGAHCPAGKEDGAGAGHGDRQRGGTVLCPQRLGKVGEIPRYALMPDGEMTATSLFYKFLP